MLTPRVRAITSSSGQPIQMQPPPSNQEQVDAIQGTVLNNFNRAVDTVMQGNQGNSQIIDQIAGNLQGLQSARRATEAYRQINDSPQQTGQAVESITNFVSKAFDVYNDYQKIRAEKLQAANAEQLAQNLVEVEIEKQKLLQNAEGLLRNPEIGYEGYNRLITGFIQRNRQYVSPEDVISYTAELYAPLRQIQSEQAKAYYGAFEEINNRQANVATERLTILFSGQLQQLNNTRNPERARELVNGIISGINEEIVSENLSPLQTIQVTDNLMTFIRENYGASTARFAEAQAGLQNLQDYATAVQTQVQPLYDSGDYQGAAALDSQLRIQYGITESTPWSDPLYNETEANRLRTERERMRTLVEGGVIDSRRMFQFDRAQVLTLALQFSTDPTQIAVWTNTPGWEENPYIAQAVELANAYRGYTEWQSSTRPQELAQSNQRIAQINESISRLQLSYLQGNSSDISQLLGSITLLQARNSSLQSYYEGQGQGDEYNRVQQSALSIQSMLQGGQATPEQIRSATEQVIQDLQRQVQIEQSLFDAQGRAQDENMRILQQWGIGSAEDFRAQAEAAGVTYQGLIEEIQAAEQQTSNNIINTPPFRLPALDTYTYGETTGVIPFRAGGLAEVGGYFSAEDHRFGASRQGGRRRHAGMDFALPVGTPIVSYLQGTVEYIDNDPGGYGRYVVIRAPDNTYHMFADVNDINVEAGQQVMPGQQIALSGNSGNGSAHLHWQIMRSPRGFSYDQSIDPLVYTSQLTQSMSAQQPRPVQQNGQRIENVYAAADIGSYRQNGGLGNDGAGNFGYQELANNRQFRIRLHQVASSIGVPAQWLADIIAFETGGTFAANARNTGSGATGLIQFYSDRGDGTKTIGGRTYRLADLARMSNVEQLNVVEAYLLERRQYSPNGYQTPADLLMAVWSTPQNQRRLQTEGFERVANSTDGNINFRNYYRRLGSHAGRQYAPIVGGTAYGGGGSGGGNPEPIHTRPRNGCPVCTNMDTKNFIQHFRQ